MGGAATRFRLAWGLAGCRNYEERCAQQPEDMQYLSRVLHCVSAALYRRRAQVYAKTLPRRLA
eukprot:2412386-Lingulodinium_polyedra.AAC.1